MLRPTTDVLRIHARLVRQAAVCVTAATVLTACGGGGSSLGGSVGGPQMTITRVIQDRGPRETFDQPPEIRLNERVTARIDYNAEAGGDEDTYSLPARELPEPGRYIIGRDGGVPVLIEVFENDGVTPVPGMQGSWIGTITQEIIDGGGVKIRVTGYTPGSYDITPRRFISSPMSPMSPMSP